MDDIVYTIRHRDLPMSASTVLSPDWLTDLILLLDAMQYSISLTWFEVRLCVHVQQLWRGCVCGVSHAIEGL